MSATIESLRYWSHFLMWLSIILPMLGALAAVGRFYVDRYERQLAIDRQQVEMRRLRQLAEPRSITPEIEKALIARFADWKERSLVVVSKMLDSESAEYGRQIGTVFERAGWRVQFNKSSLNDHKGFVVGSYTLTGKPIDRLEDFLSRIRECGIDVQYATLAQNSISGVFPPESFIIIIGSK